MAQYDVLLIQNTHATLTEYDEKFVSGTRGGVITFGASGVPATLAPGTSGYVLKSAGTGADLYWDALAAGHDAVTLQTQLDSNLLNLSDQELQLDQQTQNLVFASPNGSTGYPSFRSLVSGDIPDLSGTYQSLDATLTALAGLTYSSAGHVKITATDTFSIDTTVIVDADFSANGIMRRSGAGSYTVLTGSSSIDTVETSITDDSTHIPTSSAVKAYADGIIVAADAMTYEGVIDCSADPNYPAADAGHVYVVSVAGNIGGSSGPDVEVGDMLLCKNDSTASGDHATVGAYWDIIQVNIIGAVTGPSSAVDDRIATFNGTSGKIIQDSGYAVSDFVLDTLFDANTILKADSDNTPEALTVAEDRLVGRITSGEITALTGLEVLNNLIWSAAPASKTATGSQGEVAFDGDYLYVCVGTNVWVRTSMATNWT